MLRTSTVVSVHRTFCLISSLCPRTIAAVLIKETHGVVRLDLVFTDRRAIVRSLGITATQYTEVKYTKEIRTTHTENLSTSNNTKMMNESCVYENNNIDFK